MKSSWVTHISWLSCEKYLCNFTLYFHDFSCTFRWYAHNNTYVTLQSTAVHEASCAGSSVTWTAWRLTEDLLKTRWRLAEDAGMIFKISKCQYEHGTAEKVNVSVWCMFASAWMLGRVRRVSYTQWKLVVRHKVEDLSHTNGGQVSQQATCGIPRVNGSRHWEVATTVTSSNGKEPYALWIVVRRLGDVGRVGWIRNQPSISVDEFQWQIRQECSVPSESWKEESAQINQIVDSFAVARLQISCKRPRPHIPLIRDLQSSVRLYSLPGWDQSTAWWAGLK